MSLTPVKQRIHDGLSKVIASPNFQDWYLTHGAADGDLVVFNNCFLYRDKISTNKSTRYLSIPVVGGKVRPRNVVITEPGMVNADFKLYKSTDPQYPVSITLSQGLKVECRKLASLLFLLIGEIQDAPVSTSFNSSFAGDIRCDSSISTPVSVIEPVPGNGSIVVQNLFDPDVAWSELIALKGSHIVGDEPKIRNAFDVGFAKLREDARSRLTLPNKTTALHPRTLVCSFKESVDAQLSDYGKAVNTFLSAPGKSPAYNEVLRIAYTFADDALTLLRLLVSICDLKPVLMWGTLAEHYQLAQAFKELPWTTASNKPSLQSYVRTIKSARNRAFHNLLAFERTIEADVSGIAVRGRTVTLLPEFTKKKSTIGFDYEDREMLEVLAELSRATETPVPSNFWMKNKEVIKSFGGLLTATEAALWELNVVRR